MEGLMKMKASNRTALAFLLCFFYSQTVVAQVLDCLRNPPLPQDEFKKCFDAWSAKMDAYFANRVLEKARTNAWKVFLRG
jgi:hypothetical protein